MPGLEGVIADTDTHTRITTLFYNMYWQGIRYLFINIRYNLRSRYKNTVLTSLLPFVRTLITNCLLDRTFHTAETVFKPVPKSFENIALFIDNHHLCMLSSAEIYNPHYILFCIGIGCYYIIIIRKIHIVVEIRYCW